MTLEIFFAIILFLGIFLTAIPTVPGMLFMFMAVIVYGLMDHFQTLHPWHLAIFGGLMLLAILTDHLSGLIGAKFGGASKWSLLAGLVGMLIGLLFFPPFGLFVGLFLGVFIAEIVQFADHRKALKAASYSFVAILVGMLINVLLAIGMFVGFLVIVF